ncbi:kinase-like protein [Gigaspora margarita]|uniref:Kinase-like protein n=1 Tax=Gigaspora margarita TaxID=4874 RepID=A0A8H4ARP4_GIGMA|nr:kinase-like protein [Gigaspora margarita]
MQYANNGTLKDYLSINKGILKLNDKISIITSILEGLQFLHNHKIHSRNVLIHDRKAYLADFGLSKSLLEPKKTSEVRGVRAYVDPILLNGKSNDTNEKSSDIYSFGVLMWEIYTCRLPFDGRQDNDLAIQLCSGLRERREIRMPMQYIHIYEKCWCPDYSLRPIISEILNRLKTLKETPTCTQSDVQSTETSSHIDYSDAYRFLDYPTNEIQLYNFSKELEASITSDLFSKLIEEARKIQTFYNSYGNIQFNKRMCNQLGRYIHVAVHNVEMLQFQEGYDEILTLDNQTDHGISLELLKEKYIKLLKQFQESSTYFGLNIHFDYKIDDINDDIEETKKFIQAYERNFKNDSMFSFIKKTNDCIQNATNSELSEREIIQEPNDAEEVKPIKFVPEVIKTFHVRAALLKKLNGLVNICNFYVCGIKDGEVEAKIPWSQYGNLTTYYQNNKLNPQTKIKFAFEICNGLVFLNAVNFLHRDIKSENIVITNDCEAKITNFCNSHCRLVTDKSEKLAINSAGYAVPCQKYIVETH